MRWLQRKWVWGPLALLVLGGMATGLVLAYPRLFPPAEYCLVTFGPGGETQLLLVVRGNVMDVHRGGTLADPAEQLTLSTVDDQPGYRVAEVVETDGKTTHTDLRVFPRGTTAAGSRLSGKDGQEFTVRVKARGRYELYQIFRFSRDPDDPVVLPFSEPWMLLTYFADKQTWTRDGEDREVVAIVQTGVPGRLHPMPAFLNCEKDFPKDIHPIVDLEFPTADGPPVTMRVELTERC